MTPATSISTPANPLVPSDADLVTRTVAGERDAFAELVRRHQRILHRHLRGMGVDYDTALDLVQDAFIKAYVRLGDCRDPGHFRAWVFSIGRHLCLDYLKNIRRQTVPLGALPDLDARADAHVRSDGRDDAVRSALDVLPPLLREAFLLKHDAGYTYEEIAAVTDVSPSAVKMRVHRARQTLRVVLHEFGVGPAHVTIGPSPLVLSHENDEQGARVALPRGGAPAQSGAGMNPVGRSES